MIEPRQSTTVPKVSKINALGMTPAAGRDIGNTPIAGKMETAFSKFLRFIYA
jgi:hypothetical protein